MSLTFREAALFALEQSRKVMGPTGIDLRSDGAVVRTRTWASGEKGKPPVSGAAYVDVDVQIPIWTNINQVTTAEIAQSGGRYEVGDVKIGPITPAYPSPLPGVAAGGMTPAQLNPRITTRGVEVLYVINGAHGGEYTLLRADTMNPLEYNLFVRRRLTTPYAVASIFTTPPAITGVTPSHLPQTLGGTVTIAGSGLLGASITVGGVLVSGLTINGTGTSATFNVAASGASGSAAIVVTVAGSPSITSGLTFDPPPVLSLVAPNHAPATIANTPLTFTFSNVVAGATLKIGGTSTTITIGSGTFTCNAPTHASGATSAVLTNPDGQTGSIPFTFDAGPTLATATPSHIQATTGGSVVLAGSNFISGCTVTMLGVGVTITSFGTSNLTVTAPAHAAASGDIVVTNPDGQTSTLTNGFAYDAAPTFGSISPNPLGTLATTPGTVITGTGFVATPTVVIGGNAATSVVLNSSTQLTLTAPTHAAQTSVPVVITNPDTQAVTGSVDYSFNPGQIADVGWLRADQGVTTATGVSQWTGGGLTVSQATGSAQPTVLSGGSGMNGQKCIHFDGSSQYLSAAKTIYSSELSIWVVWRQYSNSDGRLAVLFKTGDAIDYANTHGFMLSTHTGGSTVLYYNSAAGATVAPPTTTTELISTVGLFDASGTRIRKNGAAGSPSARVQTISTDTIYLACGNTGTVTGFYNVDIAEIAIATHAWSTTELAALSTYATTRYGVGA